MKETILGILREEVDYISGQEISEKLGVSRSMIWKVIKGLREEGYKIDSVTNRGYKLNQSPDLLTAEEIRSLLGTQIMGKTIYDYTELTSTNQIAKEKAREGALEGTLVVAECQKAGKGRLGKTWESPKGTGIWMSLILRPNILPQDVSGITLVAGLATCMAIREITNLPASIKWPNDIVVNGKKICGILTEMGAEIERVNYVIVGIGINVNTLDFPEDIAHLASSLKIEGGQSYSRKEILSRTLSLFEGYYESYVESGLEHMLDQYKDLCITLKNKVSIITNKQTYYANPLDIDAKGALIIEKEDGVIETITSGEVSVRGIYGYV